MIGPDVPDHLRQTFAIFGATKPAFSDQLHVGRPNIGSRESFLARVNQMLDRGWLTNNGPFVQQFEERLCSLLGVRHCIPICNGTVALEIAIRASGMKGEVIVPAFTFVATAHSLLWQDITPIFCDIDAETHCLDPAAVERLITERTTGIIGVHVWGRPCNIAQLEKIAKEHRISLLFDAAHAFACTYKGQHIGSFGNAEVLSFHATKFFNSFEGGAIATNDDDLARKVRLMKNFGFAGLDNVISVGTNGKMTEICAAMGLTNLESIDTVIDINRTNYQAYKRFLGGIPGLRLIDFDGREKNNYQYVVLEIDDQVAGINRDYLVDILRAENVLARRYFYPGCHKMMPYTFNSLTSPKSLPVTDRISERVLSLPTGTAVDEAKISAICEIIRKSVAQSTDLNRVRKSVVT